MATKSSNRKLPGVLAFSRGFVISDGTMYSEMQGGDLQPLPVLRHGIRGTQNVAKEGRDSTSTAANATRREVSNIQQTDSAKLAPEARALVVNFGLRFIATSKTGQYSIAPSKDDSPDAIRQMRSDIDGFLGRARGSAGLDEVACRYARNIANGRWLWRNRLVANKVSVSVEIGSEVANFDSLEIPLNNFDGYSEAERKVAAIIRQNIAGESEDALRVSARVEFGMVGPVEVFPSQNYLENKPTGFARSLYCLGEREASDRTDAIRVMGQAALRDQKISNALRTIDTWYDRYDEIGRPIAIEPNGANLEAQDFFRPVSSAKSAFKLMLTLDTLDPNSDDGMFVIATLQRGGVFSGGKEGA